MPLQITEIDNSLKTIRLPQPDGGRVPRAAGNTFPVHCLCANRKPVPPAGDSTTAGPPWVRRTR